MCNKPLYRLDLRSFGLDYPRRVRALINSKPFALCNGGLFLTYAEYLDLKRFYEDNIALVPCGKCAGCVTDWVNMWTARCFLESLYHKSNLYLTCTFDDEHLPYADTVDTETGQVVSVPCLDYTVWQKFMKRLRKAFPEQNLRYRVTGEYGDTTHRPHFHAIIFGLELPDLRVKYYTNGRRKSTTPFKGCYPMYVSKKLQDIWQQGFCLVGECNLKSIKYVSNYQVKSQQLRGVYPVDPLSRQSSRPAIARVYYDNNYENLYLTDSFPRAYRLRVNHIRYFDKIFMEQNPSAWAQILKRRVALAKAVSYDTDLSREEYLTKREERMQAILSLQHRDN